MDETMALILKSHEGDKEARNRLIEENLGLVRHVVKRFEGRGHDMEDLFQIGSIGLIRAIDKFDLSYQVKFSTYAVPMIIGEIKRFLRDDGMVKVSRILKENGWKIKQEAERFSKENGREATMTELVARTGLTKEEIAMALEANVEVESIYKVTYQSDGNEVSLLEQVVPDSASGIGQALQRTGNGGSGAGDIHQDVEKEELLNHMILEQLMSELNENEKQIIQLRYFEDKTQMEVAKIIGVSQVQVSRMEKKILFAMRNKLA